MRRTRFSAVAAAVALAFAGFVGACAAPVSVDAEGAGTGEAKPASASLPLAAVTAAPVTATPAPVVAPDLAYVIVTSALESLPVYDAPDGAVVETLGPFATYGSPRTMLAVGDIGGTPGWIEVQLPERWGQHYGWVRLDDVSLGETTQRIDVYLAERELELVEAGEVVLTVSAAVGAPSTPTPLGLFYVTERIEVTDGAGGIYGPYVLALSGYSDSFTTYRGGFPQLAIHGTNAPWSIGHDASNGCVRLPNATITDLISVVGLGTPVMVHASRSEA